MDPTVNSVVKITFLLMSQLSIGLYSRYQQFVSQGSFAYHKEKVSQY